MLSKKKINANNYKFFTKEQWLSLFRRIEEINNITRVANDVGIRRQVLSEKYNQWKKHGDEFLSYGKVETIFTNYEEYMLFRRILDYKNEIRGVAHLSNSVIKKIVIKYYNELMSVRRIKKFKVSKEWIMDFRKRYCIRITSRRSYYMQWEIL